MLKPLGDPSYISMRKLLSLDAMLKGGLKPSLELGLANHCIISGVQISQIPQKTVETAKDNMKHGFGNCRAGNYH